MTFDEGLRRTVEWYRDNRAWWEPIKRGGGFAEYRAQQYGAAERVTRGSPRDGI